MRIIAGTHGSRKLKTLEGNNTRPTSDKIKEAMFSSLGTYFDGGLMLDLFGGSGGVGLEARSRGIDKSYIADNNIAAIKIIEENVKSLKEEAHIEVIRGNYQQTLEKLKALKFDFIFIDPPYDLDVVEGILIFIAQADMLRVGGTIIVEGRKNKVYSNVYGTLEKVKEKKYGSTKLTYYKGAS